MKLTIRKAPENSTKKWIAIFSEDGHVVKTTPFGANGMEDYTMHKDKTRRERYRKRHAKDLNTGDYKRAGYLSYYILWGDSTSRLKNIKMFKEKFNLI